jgi:hypothetical protein
MRIRRRRASARLRSGLAFGEGESLSFLFNASAFKFTELKKNAAFKFTGLIVCILF